MKKKQKQQPVSSKKQSERPAATGNRKYFIPLFIIVLISFIVYLPVLQNGFVNLDDDKYIQNNPMLAAFNLNEIFSRIVEGNYHPLTMLIYSVEYQLFGLSAEGYHAVNLLLHLLNVILVFYVVLYVSNKKEIALIASLLFGIHPLHVESVAWASELKDLLYTFFFLAGWICYLRYLKEPKTKLYIYCLLLFLLSLLSKAMAVSLPVVLLLTDYFKGRKLNAKVWLEKIPFFALSILFGIVAIFAQNSMDAIQDLDVFPLFQRMVFACYAYITYLQKLFIPFHLSAYYPYPIRGGVAIPEVFYVYVALFFILVTTVIYSIRFSRKMFFGIAFFSITVLLVLQLLPVGGAIMADRYTYIPSIGIFYLIGEVVYWLWIKKTETINLKLPLSILVGIMVIFFSIKTYKRCGIWENSLTLWNDVISKYQTIPIAYNNRGMLLEAENKINEAITDYNKAIELQPNFAIAYINRGIILMNQQNYEQAHLDFNNAIKLKPGFALAYNNRGNLFSKEQKNEQAFSDYNKAIELQPDYAVTYCNRGNLFLNEQKYDQALHDYNKAIGLKPDFGEAYYNKAVCEYNLGKKNEACRNLQKAVNLGLKQATDLFNQLCR